MDRQARRLIRSTAKNRKIENLGFRKLIRLGQVAIKEIIQMIHLQVHLQIPCYDLTNFYVARLTKLPNSCVFPQQPPVRVIRQDTQSNGATGGVYKTQGRNQHKLMTCAY